ncbi:uncharacterized protein LOC128955669 [Oppia nitens]|uniref:uncharacterized protein LOC128955669 n=1 Tax=Oppia nitens TaxID=1686743 RepID=UPI0023DC6973|nr:uncharacterized protein LOC128955669 [Oppia nitens]
MRGTNLTIVKFFIIIVSIIIIQSLANSHVIVDAECTKNGQRCEISNHNCCSKSCIIVNSQPKVSKCITCIKSGLYCNININQCCSKVCIPKNRNASGQTIIMITMTTVIL